MAAAALLAFGAPTPAQDLGGALDLGQLGADIGVNAAIRANVARTRSESPPPAGRRVRPAAARLTYTPSPDRRRDNLARFVAKSRTRDPQGAAQLERLFASQDVIARMHREMAAYGFRPNDVGDAYAAWWINAWLAAHGRTADPSRTQIDAVRAQAAQAMASLPQMNSASDAVKQEAAEAYLVQTALIGGQLEGAKGNPDQSRRLAMAVRTAARAAGLDLMAMDLTDQGFVSSRAPR
ncbi:hypothetical protein C7I55_21600 [Sphingomonas deserti]|uniref:Uncharacterized protein n=2 Tax=Allosphingosinicella deserti TaxID=2116704 RepID=A0A2P7QI65_9SPHN|nr:hypothetical protein C7I55_21600 [Sphingomonas deserti]